MLFEWIMLAMLTTLVVCFGGYMANISQLWKDD
jgi:hypothetical protein